MGEGATFVYREVDQGESYANIWPVIDWLQFPGTTQEQAPLQGCSWEYKYTYAPAFVGSVSDGMYGFTAQTLHQNQGLEARRSWLFDDHGVASLVTDLGGSAAPSVLTTLANQRLAGNVTVTYTNGTILTLGAGNVSLPGHVVDRVAHNGTVYVLDPLAGGTIHLEMGPRIGDYIRISTVEKRVVENVFRVSFEHNDRSAVHHARQAGVYSNLAYQIHPGHVPPVTLPLLARSSSAAHVLGNATSGLTAVAFWEAGTAAIPVLGPRSPLVTRISATAPCLVLFRPQATTEALLSVSSPLALTNQTLSLTMVGLPTVSKVSGCQWMAAETTAVFTLPEAPGPRAGQSVVCTLSFSPP